MATKKEDKKAEKDAKGKDAGKDARAAEAKPALDPIPMSEALQAELAELTSTQRAAVLMLLLGEQQASDIIRYLNPKEV